MDDVMEAIDDSQAVLLLRTFAAGRLRAGGVAETAWTPEIERALLEAFPDAAGVSPRETGTVSDGELARQAVRLLAVDPDYREAVSFLSGVAQESLVLPGMGAIALSVAALVVLQSYVLFERNPDGKIHIKIEKQPAGPGLLKAFVDAILRFGPKV
jgi:hypothetical protein